MKPVEHRQLAHTMTFDDPCCPEQICWMIFLMRRDGVSLFVSREPLLFYQWQ